MIDHTNTIYSKNEAELPWLIELCLVCDENKQDSYVTDCIGLVYIETEMELSGPIWLNTVYNEN